jgi:hypothetical protein
MVLFTLPFLVWKRQYNRYRVFYEADLIERTVLILAIGVKERERLFFAGEEFEL